MTLLDLSEGTSSRIVTIGGGPNAQQQLHELGLYPGEIVRMIRRAAFHGPLLIECGDTQIAIGRSIAEQVIIE